MLGPEHPDIATDLDNLAELYEDTGSFAKTEQLFQRAAGIEERNTRLFLLSGSEARQQAYLQNRVKATFVKVSFSLAHPTAESTALGLTSVLRYKGRVLDSISDNAARLRRSVAPRDQKLFEQLPTVAQRRSALTYSRPRNLSYKDVQEQIEKLSQEQEKLEPDLSARSAAFRQSDTPITIENVRQAMPMDAVLVEWLRHRAFDPKGSEQLWRTSVCGLLAQAHRAASGD